MASSDNPPLQQILKDTLHSSTEATSSAFSDLPNTLRNHLSTLTANFQAFADWLRDFLRQYISRKSIRLVWIVGAYLLLRPYINAFFARDVPKMPEDSGAKVQPNQIRGGGEPEERKAPDGSLVNAKPMTRKSEKPLLVGKPLEGKEGKTTGAGEGAEWGQAARKRQARFVDDWEKNETRKAEMAEGEEDIDPELLHD
ncbi:MAG: hypothetical protein Q9227_005835 [Pyrenula ochraceoflavens]